MKLNMESDINWLDTPAILCVFLRLSNLQLEDDFSPRINVRAPRYNMNARRRDIVLITRHTWPGNGWRTGSVVGTIITHARGVTRESSGVRETAAGGSSFTARATCSQ